MLYRYTESSTWQPGRPSVLCLSHALIIYPFLTSSPRVSPSHPFSHPFSQQTHHELTPPLRSFFQALCVLGYCVAPLDVAALISTFVHVIYVRVPVTLLAWGWSIWGESSFTPCRPSGFPSLFVVFVCFAENMTFLSSAYVVLCNFRNAMRTLEFHFVHCFSISLSFFYSFNLTFNFSFL